MHLRPEYQAALATKGGWLSIFIVFVLLAMLAFLRSAAASVVSGGVGGVMSLVLALLMFVPLIGLLIRKRWAYYMFLAVGIFLLIQLSLGMLASPDKLLYTDWKFDMPIVFEWLLTLGWIVYFLRSRRVYSVLLANPADTAA